MELLFELFLVLLGLQTLVILYLVVKPHFIPTAAEPKQEEKGVKEKEELISIEASESLVTGIVNSTRARQPKSGFSYYIIHKVPEGYPVPLGIYKCTWQQFQEVFPGKKWFGTGVSIKGAKDFNEAVVFWRAHFPEAMFT